MMGSEIDERTIPEEAGLVGALRELHQGLLHRSGAGRAARRSREQRRSAAARARGRRRQAGIAAPAQAPSSSQSGKTVGRVTSAAWSPGIGLHCRARLRPQKRRRGLHGRRGGIQR